MGRVMKGAVGIGHTWRGVAIVFRLVLLKHRVFYHMAGFSRVQKDVEPIPDQIEM